MNRSLKLSMLVALALGSSQLMAMDLGQVQVKSALGQPLLAEIPLHPASPAELQGMTVQLASSEQFARAGIVGGRTSIPLHFSVANAGGAHPVIRITSSVPVNDPYLDLLIQMDGKGGKSVREYAILLDPPTSPGSAVVAATPAAPSQVNPVRSATAPPPAPRRAAPVAPSPAPATASNGRYGPVERGQTLSGIARNVAPSGIDVQQMMLALKQANPDAFYHDNINALKSGAVLRVPTSAEAQAMTLAAAAVEVRRQNSDWRAGTPGKPTIVADAATRTSSSTVPDASNTESGDRLALVSPKVGGGTNGQAAGRGDKASASLREDLLRAKENMASLQQQSDDLKARLKDLTDINGKNEHLLSLKNSEIAELQAKLAAARKTPATPSTGLATTASVAAENPATPAEPVVASAGTSAVSAPVASASSALAGTATVAANPATAATSTAAPMAASSTRSVQSAVVAPVVTPVEPAPVSKPVPTPEPLAGEPWYMQTWAWAAGAVVIVLLILLALFSRRRKPVVVAGTSGSSLADRFSANPSGDGDLPGDEDVDQEQLLDQLAEHPDDIYLHLELVTLYYSRRDVERFEAAAEAMHAHVTDPSQDEWQDVLHMGEDLAPEHPLFDHHVESLPTDHAPGFDIDDYRDEGDAPVVVSSMPPTLPPGPKKVSEYNFNFDLTQPVSAEPAAAPMDADDVALVRPQDDHAAWTAPESDELPEMSQEPGDFSDDPVDTKLDLARAYLDMGDADGARAMLGEVLKEGSQMQRDTARRLLDGLS
ncbi:MAG: FimV/HubP family polar landmark protein [Rhodanobacter sp.]